MTRQVVVVGLLAVVLGASAAVVGRWEHRRDVQKQLDGMSHVLALAGGRFDSHTISGYRYGPPDCLFYQVGGRPYGAELCFDRVGRLVQAVDRTVPIPQYWTLVPTPGDARLHADPVAVQRLLRLLAAHSK